jgi:hypothetical protein
MDFAFNKIPPTPLWQRGVMYEALWQRRDSHDIMSPANNPSSFFVKRLDVRSPNVGTEREIVLETIEKSLVKSVSILQYSNTPIPHLRMKVKYPAETFSPTGPGGPFS